MIAIIIVGYNNQNDIEECFSSIKKSSHSDYRIIFIDNHSADNSVEFIKEKYPEVIIIENKENYGFAKANNIGIKKAFALGAKYIFLLNPDTVISQDCLKALIESSNTKTILQPLILLYDKGRTNLVNTAGNILHYLGFSYCGDYKKQANDFRKQKEISIASGAGMFIPVGILKKIGFFDEGFFMYHDDVDLCWRARIAGFNIKLVPRAKVWHRYLFKKNKAKMFYTERNRLLFVSKNFQLKTLFLLALIFLINEIFVLAFALAKGWFGAKLSSYFSLFRLLPSTLKERTRVQRLRLKTDRQLKKYLVAKLDFAEMNFLLLAPYAKILKLFWSLANHFI